MIKIYRSNQIRAYPFESVVDFLHWSCCLLATCCESSLAPFWYRTDRGTHWEEIPLNPSKGCVYKTPPRKRLSKSLKNVTFCHQHQRAVSLVIKYLTDNNSKYLFYQLLVANLRESQGLIQRQYVLLHLGGAREAPPSNPVGVTNTAEANVVREDMRRWESHSFDTHEYPVTEEVLCHSVADCPIT